MAERTLVVAIDDTDARWRLVIERSAKGAPAGLLTTYFEGRERGCVVLDDLRRLQPALDWAAGEAPLEGAHEASLTEGAWPASAAEFAARWNRMSPAERHRAWQHISRLQQHALEEALYDWEAVREESIDLDGRIAATRLLLLTEPTLTTSEDARRRLLAMLGEPDLPGSTA